MDHLIDLYPTPAGGRVLTLEEIGRIKGGLATAFGLDPAGYWFPLGEKTDPSLVALDLYRVDRSELDQRIDRFMIENGVRRVFALREAGPCYEQPAEASELYYNGVELFYMPHDLAWIVYCSHEKTLTLGGAITSLLTPADMAGQFQGWSGRGD